MTRCKNISDCTSPRSCFSFGGICLNETAEETKQRLSCWCRDCHRFEVLFIVCPTCGCKRCPRAESHNAQCTGTTNEQGHHSCSGCVENRASLDAMVRASRGQP